MIPRRFLLAAFAAGALLGVAWHRSGVVRATAALELPVAPEERDAIRAMARVAIHEPEVLRQALGEVDLALTPAQLDERVAVEADPAGSGTLLLHLDFPDPVDFEALAVALSRALDRRLLGALPDLRQQRIDLLERRLGVLDGVLASGGAELRGKAAMNRGVLEVERDESLRDWNSWRLRDRVPGNAVRLLTTSLQRVRRRSDPGPYAQTLVVLIMVLLALEALGTASRRVAALPAEVGGAAVAAVAPRERLELTLPADVLERLRAPPPAPAPPPDAPRPPPASAPAPVATEPELPFRVLGDLPSFPGVTRQVADSYRLPPGPGGGVAEPFQALAAKVALLRPNPRVIQVAGWSAGLGSTLLAVNLARAFARQGRRVVLVDANFRRPLLDQVFRVDPDEGLSDVLIDCEVEGLVHVVEPPHLHLLPSGPPPPAPEELLASPRFEAFLAAAREAEDLVILDGPPLDEGADALLLAALTDGVLVPVPVDVPVATLGVHLGDLEGLGVPLLGVVCAAEVGPAA